MEDNKEYYAFISYKREDEKWAKWLQDKLEHYKFPTNLNGRTDLPKNIRPTFRDVTDLKPGLLAEEINNALLNSEWLIVVCSPRAAKSPWVCKEAQTFIDLGRADHIIPFVIEGNPFSNDTATECFPEALLNLTGSKELLAANINEMGRDAAVIKVVARMFSLRFDALWRRHERVKQKNLFLFFLSSLIVIISLASIVLVFRHQKRLLQLSQSRVVAEKTEELIKDGDSYLAQLLLLEVLPDGILNNRPYSAEAEYALRKALDISSYRLPFSSIGGHGLRLSPNDIFIIGYSQSDTLYVWKSCNGELINKCHIPNISDPYYSNDFEKGREIFFISDTILCVSDSLDHLWDVVTGRLYGEYPLAHFCNHRNNTFGRGKVINMDEVRKTNIWDYDKEHIRILTRREDGCPLITDINNTPIEIIPIKNTIAAVFMPGDNEILIIKKDQFHLWSVSNHKIIWEKKNNCFKEDENASNYRDIEIESIEFNESMNMLVVSGLYYYVGSVWILSEITNPDNYSIKNQPILISKDGKVVVYNYTEREEDINYLVEFKQGKEKKDTCTQLKYPFLYENDEAGYEWVIAGLWDLKEPDRDGVYVINNGESDLFIDASTFKKKEREKVYDGKWLNVSSNKKYFVTRKDNSLIIYNNDRVINTINLSGFPDVFDVEISSNGKYLITHHVLEENDLHCIWSISNGDTIYSFQDIDTKWVFSLDGEKMYSSSGNIIRLNDLSTKKIQMDNFHYSNGNIYITPNGKYIVMWNDIEVAVWDANTYEQLWKKTLGYSKYPVYMIKSDTKGNLLLITTRREVLVYDLISGSFYKTIVDGNDLLEECLGAYFSSDGASIFIITVHGVYKYAIIPSNELIKRAKDNLKGRRLSKEERIKYHLD